MKPYVLILLGLLALFSFESCSKTKSYKIKVVAYSDDNTAVKVVDGSVKFKGRYEDEYIIEKEKNEVKLGGKTYFYLTCRQDSNVLLTLEVYVNGKLAARAVGNYEVVATIVLKDY